MSLYSEPELVKEGLREGERQKRRKRKEKGRKGKIKVATRDDEWC